LAYYIPSLIFKILLIVCKGTKNKGIFFDISKKNVTFAEKKDGK
jgi:hypothetical protein